VIKRLIRTAAMAGITLGILAGLGTTAAHADGSGTTQQSVTGDPSQWG
jgi:hypothetical protein